MSLQLKRVYDEAGPHDGHRVLVDRVWPRGLSKEDAHVDEWLRELGPSTELRKWFGHDPARWEGVDELDGNPGWSGAAPFFAGAPALSSSARAGRGWGVSLSSHRTVR